MKEPNEAYKFREAILNLKNYNKFWKLKKVVFSCMGGSAVSTANQTIQKPATKTYEINDTY